MGDITTLYKAKSDGRLFASDSIEGATRDANEPVEPVYIDTETGQYVTKAVADKAASTDEKESK